jgi:hypothetical protein
MQPIILSIFSIALFAYWFAGQQALLYWPFRELNFEQFDLHKREQLSGDAHRKGYCAVATVGAGNVLNIISGTNGFTWWQMVLVALIIGVALAASFSLVFDISFAKAFSQHWYYLGGTSATDKKENKFFGRYAGKKKAALCVAVIIVSITLLKLFFYG